jgi:hypothetical protein
VRERPDPDVVISFISAFGSPDEHFPVAFARIFDQSGIAVTGNKGRPFMTTQLNLVGTF